MINAFPFESLGFQNQISDHSFHLLQRTTWTSEEVQTISELNSVDTEKQLEIELDDTTTKAVGSLSEIQNIAFEEDGLLFIVNQINNENSFDIDCYSREQEIDATTQIKIDHNQQCIINYLKCCPRSHYP